jgi:UDP-N-acetylmuramoylalanine--D-glutamate ligase
VAKTFEGVAHRCQAALEKNGVRFFDSSIDTTPSRTVSTLSAFDNSKTVLILGGYDKNLDYSILKDAVFGTRAVIAGANTKKIYEAIRGSGAEIYVEKSFFDAVKRAIEISKDGDSVLLSPASASFDEFSSYKERADKFREIIEEN